MKDEKKWEVFHPSYFMEGYGYGDRTYQAMMHF
jgi:hypothetical protein